MAISLPLGRYLIGLRPFRPIEAWLRSSRPASDEERDQVLRYARNWALRSALFWIVAAAIFSAMGSKYGAPVVVGISATVLLGTVTACALQYLLVERIMRPITALALAGGPPPATTGTPGVKTRLTMAWTLGSAVPLLGIVAFGGADLAGADFEDSELVASSVSLALLALVIGFAAVRIAARSVSDPLDSMRDALARVESGDFSSAVAVDDGSEVGLVQAGFNSMTRGLAERERLRDAFGAYVDPSLTERVLEEGIDFEGEEVEVSLIFCDVRGFTAFSEDAPARVVVAALNDLFEEIVPVIVRHGGHASKFIGDGLLAVFGAPGRLADHAERAVAAALEIAGCVRVMEDGLQIGVGVNSGRVVAGTIGGGGRVDFTVIGDAVNTAARVESATRQTGDDVLVTEATLSRLSSRAGWEKRPALQLKGKRDSVGLFAPSA